MNLSDLTTLKIGGPAKEVITVKTESELIKILSHPSPITHHPSLLIIGSGSNLLVSDQGFDGTVIINEIKGIEQKGNSLIVKSGTLLQDLVNYANSHGLAGLQKLTGIPGTVGGAVYGNAGAYGQTISDHIINIVYLATTIPFRGLTPKISKQSCHFSYRDSIFKQTKDVILEVEFELISTDPQDLQSQSAIIIQKRLIKYPKGIKCPGSFFQNLVASTLPADILKNIPPEKIMYGKLPAGSLLEMVGAKGDKLGQIQISSYHANLFINLGGGTAKDFYALAKKYSDKVKKRFTITLDPEVQLINLPPFN